MVAVAVAEADLLQLLLQLADLRPQVIVVGQQLLVLGLEVLGLKGGGHSESVRSDYVCIVCHFQ